MENLTPSALITIIKTMTDNEKNKLLDAMGIEDRLLPKKDTKGKKTKNRLRVTVTLDDRTETVIEEEDQSQTLRKFIELVGIEDVYARARHIKSKKHPLIKIKNTTDPPGEYRISDSTEHYSIYPNYKVEDKKYIIEQIAKKLKKQVVVDIYKL